MGERQVANTPVEPDRGSPEFRRKAIFRSWFCPGAGFAFIGHGGLAILTYVVCLAMFPAMAWVALRPNALSAWIAVSVFVLSATLSVAEQFACKWATIRSVGQRVLVDQVALAGVLFWAAFAGAVTMLFIGFGALQMAGAGMGPTLALGERFLYAKHTNPDRHRPGAVIVYRLSDRSAWGQPGWLTVGRILAGPGDRLAVRRGKYLVNGVEAAAVAPTAPYGPVLEVPLTPNELTVEPAHYFVVQDNPSQSYDSQVLSWVETRHIVADRLFHIRIRGFMNAVE